MESTGWIPLSASIPLLRGTRNRQLTPSDVPISSSSTSYSFSAIGVPQQPPPSSTSFAQDSEPVAGRGSGKQQHSGRELLQIALAANEGKLFAATHGQKAATRKAMGDKLREIGIKGSDKLFVTRIEEMLVWHHSPEHALPSITGAIRASGNEPHFGAPLDSLSEMKTEYADMTDKKKEESQKKITEDEAGGHAIRNASLMRSRQSKSPASDNTKSPTTDRVVIQARFPTPECFRSSPDDNPFAPTRDPTTDTEDNSSHRWLLDDEDSYNEDSSQQSNTTSPSPRSGTSEKENVPSVRVPSVPLAPLTPTKKKRGIEPQTPAKHKHKTKRVKGCPDHSFNLIEYFEKRDAEKDRIYQAERKELMNRIDEGNRQHQEALQETKAFNARFLALLGGVLTN